MRRGAGTTPRRLRAQRVRAFTVIELMLALVLAAVVIAAAMGMYKILSASERVSEARFEQAADLAVTQMTLRRIMNTLVCAPAEPANGASDPPPNDETENADDQDDAAQEEDADAQDTDEDQAKEEEAEPEVAASGAQIMFSLLMVDTEFDRQTMTLPVIELVVSEPPVELRTPNEQIDEQDIHKTNEADTEEVLRRANRLAESVRGVLEVVPWIDGWRLQWRPIDPPAEPFPLVSNIAPGEDGAPNMMWEVLSRNDKDTADPWKGVWAAKIHAEFPQAVRLRFVTTNNEYTDWLFETHDSVQE